MPEPRKQERGYSDSRWAGIPPYEKSTKRRPAASSLCAVVFGQAFMPWLMLLLQARSFGYVLAWLRPLLAWNAAGLSFWLAKVDEVPDRAKIWRALLLRSCGSGSVGAALATGGVSARRHIIWACPTLLSFCARTSEHRLAGLTFLPEAVPSRLQDNCSRLFSVLPG